MHPIELELEHLPGGVSLQKAFPGELVKIAVSELLTPEDGVVLFDRLTELTAPYLGCLEKRGIRASQIDNLLVVITPDKKATIYCNELDLIVAIRARGDIVKGQHVTKEHISDIEGVEIRGVQIPDDAACLLVLSCGWRKGLFYDFSVYGKDRVPRTDDLKVQFGRLYSRLLFDEFHGMSETRWSNLFKWGWFPFMCLSVKDRDELIGQAIDEREPSDLLNRLAEEFCAALDSRLSSWKSKSWFKGHEVFFEKAKDHFKNKDYVSCVSVLYPRIEGILRLLCFGAGAKTNQNTMASQVVCQVHDFSLLLPARFREYLSSVYFQDFNLSAGDIPLSRHTVAHGVSSASDYSPQRAAVGFMIVDQIGFYLGRSANTSEHLADSTAPEPADSAKPGVIPPATTGA